MMSGRIGGLITLIVVVAVIGGFVLTLLNNAREARPYQVIVPTQVEPTTSQSNWEVVLQSGFSDGSTPVPTIPIPDQRFSAPTLPPAPVTTATERVSAAQLGGSELFTLEPVGIGASPTPLQPSPTGDASTALPLEERFVQQPTGTPQPPALEVPLNRDPLGRDHYIFRRPIDPLGVNFALPSYSYGSDGPQADNPLRIHHGIDMPNPEGTVTRAAASGTVIFASSEAEPYFQNSSSYGNVVVIEHDFGWLNGEPIFTLYAHLLSPLVKTGDIVQAGDPIALSGNTGRSSGAHVHFEVRMGENRYGRTFNPLLWMAPYVGHGTIAGRFIDSRGNTIDDATITVRNWGNGLIQHTTTTYVFDGTVNQVNSDPIWGENFAVGDVREGRYEVIATYDGQRISQIVDVYEGRTTFVELKPAEVTESQTNSENEG